MKLIERFRNTFLQNGDDKLYISEEGFKTLSEVDFCGDYTGEDFQDILFSGPSGTIYCVGSYDGNHHLTMQEKERLTEYSL